MITFIGWIMWVKERQMNVDSSFGGNIYIESNKGNDTNAKKNTPYYSKSVIF